MPTRQSRPAAPHTDIALAGIARHAGYESEFSFSRAFKRAFGVAPRSYREQDDDKTAMNEFLIQRGADG